MTVPLLRTLVVRAYYYCLHRLILTSLAHLTSHIGRQDSLLGYSSVSGQPHYHDSQVPVQTSVLFAPPQHIAHPTRSRPGGSNLSYSYESLSQSFYTETTTSSLVLAQTMSNFIGGQQGPLPPFRHSTNDAGDPSFSSLSQPLLVGPNPSYSESLQTHYAGTTASPFVPAHSTGNIGGHTSTATQLTSIQNSFLGLAWQVPEQAHIAGPAPDVHVHFSLCGMFISLQYFHCIDHPFKDNLFDGLKHRNMNNWISVIKDASATLCVVLCKSTALTLPESFIKKALPECVFRCARKYSDRIWSLENGTHLIVPTVIILTCNESGMDQRGQDSIQ